MIKLILIVFFIGQCCLILAANCDVNVLQKSKISNIKRRAISSFESSSNEIHIGKTGEQLFTAAEDDNHEAKGDVQSILNGIKRVTENGIRMKRAVVSGSGRPKFSTNKIRLAQRPKSTTTTTETIETAEEETESSSVESKPKADSEEETSEYDDSESENVQQTTSTTSSSKSRKETKQSKSQPITSTEKTSIKLSPQTEKGGAKKGRQKETTSSKTKDMKEINKSGAGSERQAAEGKNLTNFVKTKPLVRLPFIKPKNASICTPEAYLEFPRDLIGNKWRSRGLVLIHIIVVCYMFYSLALVCERYFMPSLEEFAQRLQLSPDVAGATLMSAGSSAPELFTAILGVFVAKGDVGTGAIVGSAGVCAFVSSTYAQLNWWPVLRDSVFYTFTVLVLILFIYDERITALESFSMIALYGVYILIMMHNDLIREHVTKTLQSYPVTAKLFSSTSVDGSDDVFGSSSTSVINTPSNKQKSYFGGNSNQNKNYQTTTLNETKKVEDDSIFLAACLVIVQHKRLFRSQLRFQSAARYIICKRQHKIEQQKLTNRSNEVNYFGPENEPLKNQKERIEAYATGASLSKNKFSIVSKDDYEFWNRPPEEGENYYVWLAKIPVNYVLHYTIPDCTLYPDKYLFTFIISITWTAFFSYIMVWMVTLIGYTFGIPDSVMGVTFLAAGTSVPDCYSSVHAARNGMADMAVSNSIGSNVFDILIGLSLPWFIQTAIYPGVVATINSRGVIYSVILLFLSLIVTIYLMNKYEWTLKPRLGLALLIAYGLFIVLTCMLEFNLFGHVNPPPC